MENMSGRIVKVSEYTADNVTSSDAAILYRTVVQRYTASNVSPAKIAYCWGEAFWSQYQLDADQMRSSRMLIERYETMHSCPRCPGQLNSWPSLQGHLRKKHCRENQALNQYLLIRFSGSQDSAYLGHLSVTQRKVIASYIYQKAAGEKEVKWPSSVTTSEAHPASSIQRPHPASMVHGSWFMVHGPQSTIHGPQSTVRGPPFTVRSPRSTGDKQLTSFYEKIRMTLSPSLTNKFQSLILFFPE
ncbi:uncharacterized protein BYT42DRAFT_546081 [Radiomyces spectabilis]|uniref:uncharacterized protein n=1 Tax=Radiomyces spectabilis TaxID=64574 RepID=UPI002220E0F3|nr:uncharacterized protein BYT42DRAFT_546081 [Radiomyces spectabilis]KAI8379782.1 hypothetical protein BYT42DRAFT_546081 [Radiomyces spectabilis]